MNIKIILIGTTFACIAALSATELKHKDIVELIKNNKLNLGQDIIYDGDTYKVTMLKHGSNRIQYELEKSITLLKTFNIGTDFIFADQSIQQLDGYIKHSRSYNDTYQSFISNLELATAAGVTIVSIVLGFHWLIKDLLKNQTNS